MHRLSNEYEKEPENNKSPSSKQHFFVSRCYLNHYFVPTAVLIVNLSPIDSVMIVPTKWVLRNFPDFSTIGTNWDAFFEIPLSSIGSKKTSEETVLFYPNQLIIVENSNLKATVINSYFKGSYWLIEAEFENQKVFLNYFSKIKTGKKICLLIE